MDFNIDSSVYSIIKYITKSTKQMLEIQRRSTKQMLEIQRSLSETMESMELSMVTLDKHNSINKGLFFILNECTFTSISTEIMSRLILSDKCLYLKIEDIQRIRNRLISDVYYEYDYVFESKRYINIGYSEYIYYLECLKDDISESYETSFNVLMEIIKYATINDIPFVEVK